MSRLIDADELIVYIKAFEIGTSISSDQKEFIDCVNKQPTAFDVEKVTDEILRASCIARPMGWDRKREIIETHTAIEIVKGGEVDDRFDK